MNSNSLRRLEHCLGTARKNVWHNQFVPVYKCILLFNQPELIFWTHAFKMEKKMIVKIELNVHLEIYIGNLIIFFIWNCFFSRTSCPFIYIYIPVYRSTCLHCVCASVSDWISFWWWWWYYWCELIGWTRRKINLPAVIIQPETNHNHKWTIFMPIKPVKQTNHKQDQKFLINKHIIFN